MIEKLTIRSLQNSKLLFYILKRAYHEDIGFQNWTINNISN